MTRKDKGRIIAFDRPESIERQGDMWTVRGTRSRPYTVSLETGGCTCPDKTRAEDPKHRCKHWWAVWYTAEEGVVYKVKRTLTTEGAVKWAVAITRCGVELVRMAPQESREEAEALKEILGAGAGVQVPA